MLDTLEAQTVGGELVEALGVEAEPAGIGVKGGDVVRIRCRYDNTLGNPFLVKALAEQGLTEPKTVELGEESLDEMCPAAVRAGDDLPLDML